MDVGFIGLGHMGQGMARNLLKGGHHVTVYNRTRSKAEPFAAEGARVADKPSDACHGDVVITMLSDDHALEEVVFGEGVLDTLPAGRIHLSMSTISPEGSTKLAEAHAAKGQRYVAAPVFGRPEAAAAAKLNIVAAGEASAIDECQPLLDAMGQHTYRLDGEPRLANIVKVSGNFMIASMIECLSEVVALYRKTGVDPEQGINVLTSALFPTPVYQNYAKTILQRNHEPGFKVTLGMKDIRLALAIAEAAASPMPVASVLKDHFVEAVALGYKDKDWTSIARVVAANAGLD